MNFQAQANKLIHLRALQKPSLLQKKAENLYCWLDWICTEMKPFSFIQSALTQQYSRLTPIALNTFMKYMNLVTKKVERKISDELPEKFALVIDGWTKNSNHFLAIFAVWANSSNVKCSALLGFSPLLDETSLDAVE